LPSQAEKLSTGKQRHLIHALAKGKYLRWTDIQLRDFLEDNYGVRSTKHLTSSQASQAITNLKALAEGRGRDIDGSTTAQERVASWNAFFATPNALRTGFPRSAEAPDPRKLRHVLGMLWEVCHRKNCPESYGQTIIFSACTKYKIETAEDCDKLFTALKTRSRKQGCPSWKA